MAGWGSGSWSTGSWGVGGIDVLVSVTGVSAAGEVGTVVANANAAVIVTGVEADCIESTQYTVRAGASVAVTGVEGVGQVGIVTTAMLVSVIGVQASGEVGTVVARAKGFTTVTGVDASALLDPVGVAAGSEIEPASFQAEVELGQETVFGTANVTLTGVEGVGETGFIEHRTINKVPVTGVESTGEVGTVVARAAANSPVFGVEADCIESTQYTVRSGASVAVTGVEGVGTLGEEEVSAEVRVFPTGVEGVGELGTADVNAKATVFIIGVVGTGQLGEAEVDSKGTVVVTGVEGTGEVETVVVRGGAYVTTTGVVGTTELGETEESGQAVVLNVSGVQAQGRIGKVLIWGDIDTSQNANWGTINTSQNPNWGAINTSQTPNWLPVAA